MSVTHRSCFHRTDNSLPAHFQLANQLQQSVGKPGEERQRLIRGKLGQKALREGCLYKATKMDTASWAGELKKETF